MNYLSGFRHLLSTRKLDRDGYCVKSAESFQQLLSRKRMLVSPPMIAFRVTDQLELFFALLRGKFTIPVENGFCKEKACGWVASLRFMVKSMNQ